MIIRENISDELAQMLYKDSTKAVKRIGSSSLIAEVNFLGDKCLLICTNGNIRLVEDNGCFRSKILNNTDEYESWAEVK